MAKKKRNRFASEAAQQSLVRFGPQLTALTQLADEAGKTYRSTTANARVAAEGTQAAVDRALPEVQGIYDQAGLAQSIANGGLLGGDLAHITGGGLGVDAIKAGAANEAATMTRNLASARAAAVADLMSRRTRASEGAQFSTENARSDLLGALTKIAQQRLALGDQRGAFESSVISDLQNAATKQAHDTAQKSADRRNRLLTAGVNPDGTVIPGGKADKPGKKGAARLPGGAKLQSTSAHSSLLSKLDAVKAVAAPLVAQAKKEGHSRAFVGRLLLHGVQGGTLHDPATGRVKVDPNTGLEQQAPSIKAQDPFLTTLTLDLLYDGHVSHRNAQMLHRRGFSLKALGLPGPPSGSASLAPAAATSALNLAQMLAGRIGR